MSTHTAGPWVLHPIKCGTAYVVPFKHSNRAVGGHAIKAEDLRIYAQEICAINHEDRHRPVAEQLANARLIAAAPELLDALSAFVNNPGLTETERQHKAIAAVAKATGATP